MTAINWKTPSNGDWNAAANWSTNKVPTSADAVAISASAPYIVTISSVDQANSLTFGASQATLLENAGSLTIGGALTVNSGFVSLNQANTIGSVALTGGVLAVGNSGALGGGTIAMSGGELLGTANETLGNQLSFSGTSTIAAAHGTTLNENAPNYAISANTTLNFGSAGQDGTVLWHTNSGSSINFPFPGVTVQAGTLKGADGGFSFILNNAAQTTVDSGATVDLAGFSTPIADLTGGGAVIDSGGPATLTLGAANFSGSISGPLSLVFNRDAALSGLEDFSGAATIGGTATVANAGEYDIVSNNGIAGTPASFFINNGLFEKTGGGGVSNVTSDFVNNGTITVTSGSVSFSGGFTNDGVINGVVSQSGGVTTISAPPNQPPTQATHTVSVNESASTGTLSAGDTDPDGDSITVTALSSGMVGSPDAGTYGTLILNANDTFSYAANNMSAINAAPAGTNPTDTFSYTVSDGRGGNTTETLEFTTQRPPQVANSNVDEWILSDGHWAASAEPGSIPSGYQAAGVGDFNGNGTSDILWQNSATGDTQEWLLDNGGWAGTVDLGTHPGNFQIAGVGNFFGNGRDGVLWTSVNGDGTVATDIWQLGSDGKWANSVSPGSHPAGYSVAGVGDFNGDGTSDILWYNASTGGTDEWQLANGQWSQSVDLGSHPGSGWSIAGVGDFDGDGRDDVLWTSVNGDGTIATDIWELGSNGQWMASVSPSNHPAGYQVAGVGDFTGNGTSDILWQNPTTGDVDEWLINNGQWAGSIDLGSHLSNFRLAGTGAFVNGNPASDILWHAST